MIKLIETVTKKTGESDTTTKEFQDMRSLERSLTKAAISGPIRYDLLRKREATIEYSDATVVIKVVDDSPPKAKILGLDGKPYIDLAKRELDRQVDQILRDKDECVGD